MTANLVAEVVDTVESNSLDVFAEDNLAQFFFLFLTTAKRARADLKTELTIGERQI